MLESLSEDGGPASDQLKLVEQMQIEQAVRMSLPGNKGTIKCADANVMTLFCNYVKAE